jgi:hypothetical protein
VSSLVDTKGMSFSLGIHCIDLRKSCEYIVSAPTLTTFGAGLRLNRRANGELLDFGNSYYQ